MADFLSEKLAEIDRRLEELKPLHEEFLRLERARTALAGLDGSARPAAEAPAARQPRARRDGGSSQTRRPIARRRRQGGTRAEQALEVVRQTPGITVSELASRLGIAQANYMYRVMNGLQADGAVSKRGRGYVAV
jgi:hypothetical protein